MFFFFNVNKYLNNLKLAATLAPPYNSFNLKLAIAGNVGMRIIFQCRTPLERVGTCASERTHARDNPRRPESTTAEHPRKFPKGRVAPVSGKNLSLDQSRVGRRVSNDWTVSLVVAKPGMFTSTRLTIVATILYIMKVR